MHIYQLNLKQLSFSISKNMYSANQNSAMMMNQNSMMQMNAMTGMGGGMGMMGMGMMMNPQYFFFTGNSLSLQARLDNMTTEADTYIDAKITVTGVEVKPMRICSLILTFMCACLIFPICFMCMDWWKRCTYGAYSVHNSVYIALGKIILGAKISNVSLTVTDNTFNQQKAQILYNHLLRSQLKGFTFINHAQGYDFEGNEYSKFIENMKPIKTLTNVTSDMRWYTEIVPY